MRLLFTVLFWFVYFPLMRLIVLFLFWNSKMEERERFEKKNKFEALAHSFKEKNERADLCFEFSSEGEYQQVAPLIEDALKAGKKIELVFFSPSVEKTILRLAGQHPKQIRYLRYPFVRIFPFIPRRSFTHWMTAKTLVLVRYDFFPEFLLWSMKKDHDLKIVWMTFKKERLRSKKPGLWKRLFLKNSSSIVYAGESDRKLGEELGYPGVSYDFRMEQIHRRVERRDEKFSATFPLHADLKKNMSRFSRSLLIGNAWPSDMFLLRDLPQSTFLMIVPHDLKEEILEQFRTLLKKSGRSFFELNDQSLELPSTSCVLLNKKGVLCELYSDFPLSYVGGGFEGSIHSVLEPLIAGSERISCGPQNHRSTEFDVAKEQGKISEVNTPEQFLEWHNQNENSRGHGSIKELISGYEKAREIVISC